MGRAMAHGRSDVSRFSDPVAFDLLSGENQARVEAVRAGHPPRGLRDGVFFEYMKRQAYVMVARTVAIDDAIRAAKTPQVVILGAGLDGRAWRMTELHDATVYEVDHPDTQESKRVRVTGLPPAAREVRFVPVDFERNRLGEALAAAGHDPTVPTTWIWEGVVMYLAPCDIASTLAVVQERSAKGSTLVVAYHSPAALLMLIGAIVARLGEPLKSRFTPPEFEELLARYRFEVTTDQNIAEIGATLSPLLAEQTKPVKHLRVVTAISL